MCSCAKNFRPCQQEHILDLLSPPSLWHCIALSPSRPKISLQTFSQASSGNTFLGANTAINMSNAKELKSCSSAFLFLSAVGLPKKMLRSFLSSASLQLALQQKILGLDLPPFQATHQDAAVVLSLKLLQIWSHLTELKRESPQLPTSTRMEHSRTMASSMTSSRGTFENWIDSRSTQTTEPI